LEQGVCYIHSNARSLEVQTGADGLSYLSLGDPAPDPLNRLFASAAEAFGAHAIGVMLTGTGDDGARGFARIREQSGVTIAQDQSCCVYPNLTDNVTRRGLVDLVIDEKRLPDAIRRICAGEPVDR
jgi:chemotaxis response regulator CheB